MFCSSHDSAAFDSFLAVVEHGATSAREKPEGEETRGGDAKGLTLEEAAVAEGLVKSLPGEYAAYVDVAEKTDGGSLVRVFFDYIKKEGRLYGEESKLNKGGEWSL